jgi:hypothetical protein
VTVINPQEFGRLQAQVETLIQSDAAKTDLLVKLADDMQAVRLREQKHHAWGWTADVIDALFFWQANHCREQFDREKAAGGVWKAWAAS